MRFKTCKVCNVQFETKSQASDLVRYMCSPCNRIYAREVRENPRVPGPCLVCLNPTGDSRATVKYCPDHRFHVRKKKCAGCGKMWLPKNWTAFQARSRCDRCFSTARKKYRRVAARNLRQPRPCTHCGCPTGDIRQSVRYCKDHSFVGRWWTEWKNRAARTQSEYVARIEELERLKPLMEERKWLVQAKMELSKVKRLLREKNRKRQESA